MSLAKQNPNQNQNQNREAPAAPKQPAQQSPQPKKK